MWDGNLTYKIFSNVQLLLTKQLFLPFHRILRVQCLIMVHLAHKSHLGKMSYGEAMNLLTKNVGLWKKLQSMYIFKSVFH